MPSMLCSPAEITLAALVQGSLIKGNLAPSIYLGEAKQGISRGTDGILLPIPGKINLEFGDRGFKYP